MPYALSFMFFRANLFVSITTLFLLYILASCGYYLLTGQLLASSLLCPMTLVQSTVSTYHDLVIYEDILC